MTIRNREERSLASEDLLYPLDQESKLFDQSLDVDEWCQSVAISPEFPLTPPESDCSLSDLEMSGPWSDPSLPEDAWYTGHAQDSNTYGHPPKGQHAYASSPEYVSAEPSPWSQSHRNVDSGASPVLSYLCQNTQPLSAHSDPGCNAGPQLDGLSASQLEWNAMDPVLSYGSQYPQPPLPGNQFVPAWEDRFVGPAESAPVAEWASSTLTHLAGEPVLFAGPTSMGHAMPPHPVMSGRPILPRMEAPVMARMPAHGLTSSQRHIRPMIRRRAVSRNSGASVSSSQPCGQGAQFDTPRTVVRSTPPASPYKAGVSASVLTGTHIVHMERKASGRSATTTPFVPDPTAEEFNAFIQYDQVDSPFIPGAPSAAHGLLPGEPAPLLPTPPEQVDSKRDPVLETGPFTTRSTSSTPLEFDEGRHRNHALYSKGPEPDGLFHCPFNAKEDCPHKPTKLKCNYDKFVDSHLKPFRCKAAACVKQEFSSTACLLRHEREAHGMHGHGDRPHLCLYPGCERGFAGNGFPRRYNLFDHMKRVHDHKDEPQSGHGSPDLTGAEASRTVGRKRKAPSSTVSEPATRRRKMSPQTNLGRTVVTPTLTNSTFMASGQVFNQVMGQVPPAFSVDAAMFGKQARSPVVRGPPPPGLFAQGRTAIPQPVLQPVQANPQWNVHSQWAHQRQVLARQLEHGVPDEAGMERLSQDFLEYRRLSTEARQG